MRCLKCDRIPAIREAKEFSVNWHQVDHDWTVLISADRSTHIVFEPFREKAIVKFVLFDETADSGGNIEILRRSWCAGASVGNQQSDHRTSKEHHIDDAALRTESLHSIGDEAPTLY